MSLGPHVSVYEFGNKQCCDSNDAFEQISHMGMSNPHPNRLISGFDGIMTRARACVPTHNLSRRMGCSTVLGMTHHEPAQHVQCFSTAQQGISITAQAQAKAADLHLVTNRRCSLCLLGQGADLSTQGAGGVLKRTDPPLEADVVALQGTHLCLQVAIHLQTHQIMVVRADGHMGRAFAYTACHKC